MRFVKNTAVTNDGEIAEKKIGNSYTTEQIIETLRSMYGTIAHIAAKQKTAASIDFTGFTTVFLLSNCQRWDYIIEKIFCTNKSRMRLEPCELGKEWL